MNDTRPRTPCDTCLYLRVYVCSTLRISQQLASCKYGLRAPHHSSTPAVSFCCSCSYSHEQIVPALNIVKPCLSDCCNMHGTIARIATLCILFSVMPGSCVLGWAYFRDRCLRKYAHPLFEQPLKLIIANGCIIRR